MCGLMKKNYIHLQPYPHTMLFKAGPMTCFNLVFYLVCCIDIVFVFDMYLVKLRRNMLSSFLNSSLVATGRDKKVKYDPGSLV